MFLNSIIELLHNQDQRFINEHLDETFNPDTRNLAQLAYEKKIHASPVENKQINSETNFLLKKNKLGATLLSAAIEHPQLLLNLLRYRDKNEFNPFTTLLNETCPQGNTLLHLLISHWVSHDSLDRAIYLEIIEYLLEHFEKSINPFIKNNREETIADYYIEYLNAKPTPPDEHEHQLFQQFVKRHYLLNASIPLSFPLASKLDIFTLNPFFEINSELMPNTNPIESPIDYFRETRVLGVARALEKLIRIKNNTIVGIIISGRALTFYNYFCGLEKIVSGKNNYSALPLEKSMNYQTLSSLLKTTLTDIRKLKAHLEDSYEGKLILNNYYLVRRAAVAASSGLILAGVGFLIYVISELTLFFMKPSSPYYVIADYEEYTCYNVLTHKLFSCEIPQYEDEGRNPEVGASLIFAGVIAVILLVMFAHLAYIISRWYLNPTRPDTLHILRQNPLISGEHNEVINQLVNWFELNNFYFNPLINPHLVIPVVNNQPITLDVAFQKLRVMEESIQTLQKLISEYEIKPEETFPLLSKQHYPIGFFKQLQNPKTRQEVAEVSVDVGIPNIFGAIAF